MLLKNLALPYQLPTLNTDVKEGQLLKLTGFMLGAFINLCRIIGEN